MNINETFTILIGFIWIYYFNQFKKQAILMYGENGIRPLLTTMKNINKVTNYWTKFLTFPSIFWNISPSDENIILIINIGITSSILSIFTLHKSLFLFINYIIHISFVSIGSEFLFYQWDSFLLEITFISSIYHLFNYDYIVKLFIYYIYLKLNILNFIKKVTFDNQWITGKALKKHLYTQPLPRKDNLYLYHYSILTTILNYYIILHELLIPICIFYFPTTGTISLFIYTILGILIQNVAIYYITYLNIGLLLTNYNLFYNIYSSNIDILYPCVLILLLYLYISNPNLCSYYHINKNYDMFNVVNNKKKKFVIYIINNLDKVKIQFNEMTLFNHNFILWHLFNSTILSSGINTWITNFVKIILENDNDIILNKNIKGNNIVVLLKEIIPNTFDNIMNGINWKVINTKEYLKIKLD